LYHSDSYNINIIDTIGVHPTLNNMIKIIAVCIKNKLVIDSIIIIDNGRPGMFHYYAASLGLSKFNFLNVNTQLFYNTIQLGVGIQDYFSCIDKRFAEDVNTNFNYLKVPLNPSEIEKSGLLQLLKRVFFEQVDGSSQFKSITYEDHLAKIEDDEILSQREEVLRCNIMKQIRKCVDIDDDSIFLSE